MSNCPHCGHEAGAAGANFCQRCGGALRGAPCPKCNASSEAGDRFCNQCGATLPTEAKASGLSSIHPAWAVVGILATALIVVLALQRTGGREIDMAPPPAASTQGSPPDLSSMTPREAADRLFERVMRAVDGGNDAEVAQFLPMAISAYDRIGTLTLDDRFHLSLLHAAGGDGPQALAVAEAGLAQRDTHLLLLAAAAEAALVLGDTDETRRYYQSFVDSWDEEIAAALPEYAPGVHADLLNTLRSEAEAFLAGGGE
ncbi:MAG: zinc ribbon domain-containing protein [Gemmatimonadetes bacterium]|nr:zinc ribbon domain-containing protein [Gemmatimonadota bacterium]